MRKGVAILIIGMTEAYSPPTLDMMSRTPVYSVVNSFSM
jgi:hypothetical protein